MFSGGGVITPIFRRRAPRLRGIRTSPVTWLVRGRVSNPCPLGLRLRRRPESPRIRGSGVPAHPVQEQGSEATQCLFAFAPLCPEREWSISNLIPSLQSMQHHSLTMCIQASPQGDEKKWNRALRNHVPYMKIDQAVGGGDLKIAWGSERQNMWNSEREAETTVMCGRKGRMQRGADEVKRRDGSFWDAAPPSIHPSGRIIPKKTGCFTLCQLSYRTTSSVVYLPFQEHLKEIYKETNGLIDNISPRFDINAFII